MPKYLAYGLRLSANARIPTLREHDFSGPADVHVWLNARPEIEDAVELITRPPSQRSQPSLVQWFRLRPSGILRISYIDGTEFHVSRDGREVWATWTEPYTVEDMATYLVGPILGYLLRLRNTLVLHASAVVVNGQAIALMGGSGTGKSTTAAAFAALGFPILSDDASALDERAGGFLVQPAYPHLRLWPTSVASLYGNGEALPPITPNWDKRDFNLLDEHRFHGQPTRLAAIYLLAKRTKSYRAPFVETSTRHDAFRSLVANTYGNTVLDETMRANEFPGLGRLANTVPIRRLTPHADLRTLDCLCDLVICDFKANVLAAPQARFA